MKKKQPKMVSVARISRAAETLQAAICDLDPRGDNEMVTLILTFATLSEKALKKGKRMTIPQLCAAGRAIYKEQNGREYAG